MDYLEQHADEIIKEYYEKLSSKYLAEKYNVAKATMTKFLKLHNINLEKPYGFYRKYSLDETFFDNIDSEEKAYFLGLLYADGYNSEQRNTVRLCLAEEDKETVLSFAKALKTNKPVRYQIKNQPNRKNVYVLDIISARMSKRLKELGCPQAKTFLIKFPDFLDKSLINHFIRGYFDGDGHIGITGKVARFSLVGTEDFCDSVTKIFSDILGVHSRIVKIHPERCNNITSFVVQGNQQIIKVANFLYQNATIFMQRKYDKYLEILKVDDTIHIKQRYCQICGKPIKYWKYCKKCYYRNF